MQHFSGFLELLGKHGLKEVVRCCFPENKSPQERRGGDRSTAKFALKYLAVKSFTN